jgi:hypothetical protein
VPATVGARDGDAQAEKVDDGGALDRPPLPEPDES